MFLHQKVSKDKTVASLERATNQKEVKYFMELNNMMVNKIKQVKEMMAFYSKLSYGAWKMLRHQRSVFCSGLCWKAALLPCSSVIQIRQF